PARGEDRGPHRVAHTRFPLPPDGPQRRATANVVRESSRPHDHVTATRALVGSAWPPERLVAPGERARGAREDEQQIRPPVEVDPRERVDIRPERRELRPACNGAP